MTDRLPGAELYDGASLGDEAGAPTPNLLTSDPKTAAKDLVALWTALDPLMRHRLACWEANQLRRDGYVNVRVVRRQDRAQYAVFPPPDRRGQPAVHTFNKARWLCRTFVGNLLADPPAPVVEPTSDSDEDRDAAEMSQRALEDLQSPQHLDTGGAIRQALDRSSTYGSGFIRYYVDPAKGGRHPIAMQASPLATHRDAPLVDPATGEPHGALVPGLDPLSGQPTYTRQTPPAPIERYVRPDGTLSDEADEADLEWRAGLCREVLDGRHVRFLPWGSDRTNAETVLVATYITLREARQMVRAYDLTLTEEQEKDLTKYRPDQGDYLLPDDRRGDRDRAGDEALVFCLTAVWRECPDYPDGAYITALGDQLAVFRDTWTATVQGRRMALPLPVAQVKQWTNGRTDPYGDGLMDDLGGPNEVRAAQIGHLMQYLDTWNNMPVFIPSTSPMTDADFLSRRFIRTLPGQEPRALKGPGYDSASMELFGITGQEMDSASHLQQAAQGVEDPSVQSGRHAFQIITQVHAQLSEPKQHVELGYLQASTIELALVRAFGLVGETRWEGEDGRYKYDRWLGADLGGDVRLKPGTMTMLSPGAKAQLIQSWMGTVLDPDTAQEMLAHNVSATLGRWDDPFLLEIKRSIAVWEQGPPAGYQPPQSQPMQAIVQTPAGPVPQIVPGPVPPDTVALRVFPPKPHHALPLVARKRLDQLARLMASHRYDQQPAVWQAMVNAEYQRMQAFLAPPAAPAGAPGTGPAPSGAQTPDPTAPASPGNPTLDPRQAA